MSRPRFVLTPQARADLLEIWNYISEDSPENADRVLERLYAAFTRLAETPGMGHHREDLADPRHRFWTIFSYVIAYRDQTSPLEVIAIVHGARHLEAFFQHRIGGRLPRQPNERGAYPRPWRRGGARQDQATDARFRLHPAHARHVRAGARRFSAGGCPRSGWRSPAPPCNPGGRRSNPRRLAPTSVNRKLSAVRELAAEAACNGQFQPTSRQRSRLCR